MPSSYTHVYTRAPTPIPTNTHTHTRITPHTHTHTHTRACRCAPLVGAILPAVLSALGAAVAECVAWAPSLLLLDYLDLLCCTQVCVYVCGSVCVCIYGVCESAWGGRACFCIFGPCWPTEQRRQQQTPPYTLQAASDGQAPPPGQHEALQASEVLVGMAEELKAAGCPLLLVATAEDAAGCTPACARCVRACVRLCVCVCVCVFVCVRV